MLFRSSSPLAVLFSLTVVAAGCGSEADTPVVPPVPAPPAPPPAQTTACAEATGTYTATREPSNVLLLLDRSGSMHIELPSGDTRWAAAKAGLFELLAKLPDTAQVGAMMFPQGDAPVNAWCSIDPSINDVRCKKGWPEPSQKLRCDAATYRAGVESALLGATQRRAIESYVSASDKEFYWGTPLASALRGALQAQKASPVAGSRSVVLLTDGNPTSCDEAGVSNDIANVVAAAEEGVSGTLVRTFVIGVVDGARQAAKAEKLSPIAVAGGTKRFPGCEATNDCFYAVTQGDFASDLQKALDQISLQAFDCTFNLPAASAETDAAKVNVTLTASGSSRTVARDAAHQNGWDYLPGGTQVQLYGQACTDVKAEGSRLDVVLGCKTVEASP